MGTKESDSEYFRVQHINNEFLKKNGNKAIHDGVRKVIINACHGGFGLSKKAYDYIGLTWDDYGSCCNDYELRDLKLLVDCIEQLGDEASGGFAELKVIEIPAAVEWEIDEYDGWEKIHEKHRVWG